MRPILLTVALLLLGCPADLDEITAQLDGLRWELPCGAEADAVSCFCPDEDVDVTELAGEEDVTYAITLRFLGIVEQKTYEDPDEHDGMWFEGGTPDGGTFNIYSLSVSSPEQTYYLNGGASGIGRVWLVDFEKTVSAVGGATVTLRADSGGDEREIVNRDDEGEPIVVPGVPPAPDPYDGQFVQMDVVEVRREG